MKLTISILAATFAAIAFGETCTACKAEPTGAVGRWAIQKPGAFWLGICDKGAKPEASLLWGGGSPNAQYDIKIDGANATMKQRVGKDRYRLTTVKANGKEADITFQKTVCDIYRAEAAADPSFLRVDCAGPDGGMLPPDVISSRVEALVDHYLGKAL